MKYQDGEYYHIFNRGAHKLEIFYTDEHYERCLQLLRKYSPRYRTTIIAYCFMPNHFHLICRQEPGGSISSFIQTTFNAYSQAVNKQRRHSGTLFQGRAKAKCIRSDSYAVQVIRYIHLNPTAAGLVEKPEEWRFSDYRDWIFRPSEGVTPSEGLHLRNSYFQNGDRYREFVVNYHDSSRIEGYLFKE